MRYGFSLVRVPFPNIVPPSVDTFMKGTTGFKGISLCSMCVSVLVFSCGPCMQTKGKHYYRIYIYNNGDIVYI